jgi:Rieske 2Fe-2S family protein
MVTQSKRTSGGARALAGNYYTSSAIFAQEMQQLFGSRWLCTVHQSTLPQPGSHTLYELAPSKPGPEPVPNESVLIMRGDDGEIRAFYNVCRHRGARLRQTGGQLSGNCIRCPYHAWTYALDGRLLGAPNMADVAGFERGEHPLIPVSTAIWEGFVFINLDPAPVPFEQAFASILSSFAAWQIPRLVVARRVEYVVAANWKLLFQNYSECYHCPTIHPALNQLTPYLGADNDHVSGEILGGPMQIQEPEGSMTESGHLCAPALVSGAERLRVYYYTLFPNMFLSLHPDYVLVHRLDPLAIDRTRVICEWLFDPTYREQEGANPDEAVAFWDRVNREDWQVCELAQQGVRSRGYVPGMYSELESTTAAFDRAYLEALEHAAAR